MEIIPGIEAIDLALWIPKEKILILADFHIGFEEALQKQGVLVPRHQYKDIIDRLEKIFSKVQPETIVLNGDIKHEFGGISQQEWKETMRLIDYLERKCPHLVLVRGNHDTILGPIAQKQNIDVVEEFRTDGILIVHGHQIPRHLENTIIIGHDHPALSLREEARTEKFKCFLKGTFNKSTLIVQPSFNLIVEGTDVLKESFLSPLLQQDLGDFEAYVVDERQQKVLYFGPLKAQKHP